MVPLSLKVSSYCSELGNPLGCLRSVDLGLEERRSTIKADGEDLAQSICTTRFCDSFMKIDAVSCSGIAYRFCNSVCFSTDFFW